MRRFIVIALCLFIAGCGSTSPVSAPHPTATPLRGYTDPVTHVGAQVKKLVLKRGYALLLIDLHNGGTQPYQPGATVPFLDSGLTGPGAPGTVGSCDSDSTLGTGLDYSLVPPATTHRGWIRCDYPHNAQVLAIFWDNQQIAGYSLT